MSALLPASLMKDVVRQSFRKLLPDATFRNPVLFLLHLVTIGASLITIQHIIVGLEWSVSLQITLWLWFTLLFANFAESLAEGRGKAQASSLRKSKTDTMAKRLKNIDSKNFDLVPASSLRQGDYVLAEANDFIPGDGEIVRGIATVDESAVTGESAPVIRESGGDRSAVTGGTRIVSDSVVIEITANPGESFLDRMICMVEGANRQKTPNEIALSLLLIGFSLIFLLVTSSLYVFAGFADVQIPVIYLIALFVALIPTTIGGLLSAIGIAGMDRLIQFNVVAKSGRAVEAAGDVTILLLDKTGTITLGSRMASEFIAMPGVSENELAYVAAYSSWQDDTAEGKSIVQFAQQKYKIDVEEQTIAQSAFLPFSAQTRMSGVDSPSKIIRKGAVDSIIKYMQENFADKLVLPKALNDAVERVAKAGGTPLVVSQDHIILGVIYLKDIIKPGMKERFAQMRAMGINTIMITGDNPLTAAAIAAEAGVDGFMAEATPERKLELIREHQAKGNLVAMCGDGSNDAPALAQADVGVAMNTGTQACREAGNMIDLDSDPTKLIEIVMIGKQLLMTRGALTTFSLANDIAKYFALIPALFIASYPAINALNIMQLHSQESAVLSAIIFNALSIIALIPLALKGVTYRPGSAGAVLRRNVLFYGLGGLITPFISIKIIDWIVVHIGLVS